MDTAVAPHRGGTVLGLGIIGLLTPFIFLPVGLAAWLMGRKDLRAMNEGRMDPGGRTTTQLGQVFGIAGMALWLIAVFGLVVLLAGVQTDTHARFELLPSSVDQPAAPR